MRRIQPLSILFLLLSAGLFTLSPAVPAEEAAEGDSLRAAAEKGDLSSQFKLANEYFYGTPERRINYTLAAYWYRKVADAGVAATAAPTLEFQKITIDHSVLVRFMLE